MSYYEKRKEEVRQEAIDWSYEVADRAMSYAELAEVQERFETLGRRFGLLTEFRENAIC